MPLFWIWFHLAIGLCLALDLFVFNRNPHQIRLREAAVTSAVWISLSLLFMLGVGWKRGHEDAVVFLTAYLMEQSLSIDNLFVFYLLFRHFGIKKENEHRLLFYGVLGAIVMRATFIGLGVGLVAMFHFLFYVFGAFLVWSGIAMARSEHTEEDTEGKIVAFLRKRIPIAPPGADGFFEIVDGKWMATSAGFALIAIETTDLLFAVDSIPAVLGITQDFFLAYTSNICAILGLRSLYFLLAGAIGKFKRLHYGLSFVLVFIGVKMILGAADLIHIPVLLSLGVIALSVGTPVVLDLAWPKAGAVEPPSEA